MSINYLLATVLFLFAMCVLGQGGIGKYFIGTSRGVITITSSGLLREVPFTDGHNEIMFDIEFDSYISYLTGDGNTVWDIQGGSYTSGTPIGMYAQKSAASAANQRWIYGTPGYNKIASQHSPNLVANVSANGYLHLAPATAVPNLSAYQRMYLLSFESDLLIALPFANYMNSTVTITATSPVGPWSLSVPKNTMLTKNVMAGSVVTVFDASGKKIPPATHTLLADWESATVRIPPVSAPAGGSTWNGHYKVNSTFTATISIYIWSFYSGTFGGTGTDSAFGQFNITYGEYTNIGNVFIDTTYLSTSGFFDGQWSNAPCTSMNGTYSIGGGANIYMVLNKA